jgi:uncharacterized protein YvpB
LRRILKTKPTGTTVLNLLFLRDEKRWNLDVEISVGRPDELYANIASYKIPIIVFVSTEFLPHWDEASYHVVLVVGYNEDAVIINDPFFDKEEISLPIADFLKAWGKEHNYMVVIKKKEG